MIFVGIDPGLDGAIARVDGERRRIVVTDTPTIEIMRGGKRKREYNFKAMYDLLVESFDEFMAGCPVAKSGAVTTYRAPVITMEAVHAMPSDGKCSAFTFGLGYGAWLALVCSFAIEPNLVAPQAWKRTMLAGVPNDKRAEAIALKQRFQGHPVASQLHGPRGGLRDGRVDALWLAEYGRVTWKLAARPAEPR